MTVEDLYGLPDDGRVYELQAGSLISEPLPGARHVARELRASGAARGRAHQRPRLHPRSLAGHGAGPDVSFVLRERYEQAGDPPTAFPGAPDLAVEVLSPSDSAAAIHAKVADYLAAGTRAVWVVDPQDQTVAVYRTLFSPRVLVADDELEGEELLPGFRLRVGELFEI